MEPIEIYEIMCDAQMILRQALNVIGITRTIQNSNNQENLYFVLCFVEIFISITEIVELLEDETTLNHYLRSKFQLFLISTRESVVNVSTQSFDWLITHRNLVFGKLIYSIVTLNRAIEIEKRRLLKR